MSFSINTNVESLQAQNYLGQSSKFQNQTISEVTSGLRITQSGDDAAGLAIANGYRSDEAVLTQGIQNATDGQSQLQIMDGGMSNISQLLDRARTLATESATGTYTGSRDVLNTEFQSVLGEIDRQAQAIGLNTGGEFAKNLSVFIGGGTASGNVNAISDGSVSVNLSQSTVDSASLGLQGVQAIGATGTDIGTGSGTTSVTSILANTTNQASETTPNTTTFYLKGPGFSGQGVAISVNTKNIGGTSDLVGAINSAIQAAGTNGTQQGTALANADITASVNTDSAGRQQLTFNSSVAAFQVQAGDQMANALMGNFQAVNAAATGTDTQSTLNTTAAGTIAFQFDGSGQTVNVTNIPTGAATTKTAIVQALNANSNFHAAATASLNGSQVVITSNNTTSNSAVTVVDGGAGSLSELLGLTTNGNVTTAAGAASTGATLTTSVLGSAVTGLGSTQFTAANAGNIQVQFSGAGLSSPVTLTVAATAGETLTSVVNDLNTQVSSNSALEGAGITLSPTSNVLDGNHQLLFTSSSGQAFNVAVTGDTTNQLGFGSFQAGEGGAFDYTTLTGGTYNAGTATTQGTAAGNATLQFSINGQASSANNIGVNLSALPSATSAVVTGSATIANPITISAAGGVAASLQVGSPVAASTTVGGLDSAVATLGSQAAGTATIGALVNAAATLGAPVAGTATLTTNVAAQTTIGGLTPATATISNTAAASTTFGGVKAALTSGAGNAALTFTAAAAGTPGNSITVALVNGGNNQSLSSTVSGNVITVNLATNGAGAVTSTASQVASYLEDQSAFTALASVTAGGTGASAVVAAGATNLTGGSTTAGLSITAKTPGTAGDAINVTFQHAGNSSPLSATVTGNNVVVNLATSAGGAITSTASQVNTFLNNYAPFSAIAASALTGSGAGTFADAAATYLTGGGDAATTSFGGPLTAGLTLGSGNSGLNFTAATSGSGGNAITVQLAQSGTNTALGVSVSANAITVNLATDGTGAITSTASQVADYLASQSVFTALASVAATGSGAGLVSNAAATNLTGGGNSGLTITAATPGAAGDAINVTFQHSGDSSSLGATVTGNNVVVNLATDANGNATSTAAQVNTYLASDANFTAIAASSLTGGNAGDGIVADSAATNLTGGAAPSLTFTAATPGVPASPITVKLAAGAVNQALGVSVSGSNITVNLATDANGDVTSTSDQVAAYLASQSSFTALANVTAGSANGIIAAHSAVSLTGGDNSALTFTAAQTGTAGNNINVTFQHSGDNSSLGATVTGNNVVVNLATDANGNITSTANAVAAYLGTQSNFTNLATVSTATGGGTSLVSDTATTNLAGGGVAALHFTAAATGTPPNPITVTLVKGAANSALGVTLGGGNNTDFTVNLATDANDNITSTASQVATYLGSQAVFTNLANVSVASGGNVVVGAAGQTTLAGGGNPALTFTAATGGTAGNNVTVQLEHSGDNSSLGFSVSGNNIVVNLATDANGNIAASNTATTVANYLQGQSSFTALANVAVDTTGGATGASLVADVAQTALTGGGHPQLTFTAATPGTPAYPLTVTMAAAGNNTALGVTVGGAHGNNITVHLATDANGNVTSTASQVASYLAGQSAFTALANVAVTSGGNVIVPAASSTTLTGYGNNSLTFTSAAGGPAGDALSVALQNTGANSALGYSINGNAITVNLATDANGNVTSTAAQVAAYLNGQSGFTALAAVADAGGGTGIVAPTAATNLADGGTTALQFTAVTPGASGDNLSVQFTHSADNAALGYTVSGNNITVNLATDASGNITSTAQNIVNLFSGNSLVTASLVRGDGAHVVSNLAQTSLTNGGDAGLTFTSTTPGTAGNLDTIALVNPGDSGTLGVTVGGNATTGYNFVVNLGTDANGNITSTASQVANLLNTDSTTSGLISVGTVGGGNNVVSALSQTSLAGGGLSGPDTNNQLNLTVNGHAYNVTLASGANVTLGSIANQINNTGDFASNGTATVQNNQLVITSTLKGADASVQVEDGTANNTLGLATGSTYGTSATGSDIQNYLNQQFAANQVLQKAGLTASFSNNQLTVTSNNGTNFRVNEIAGSPATSGQVVGAAQLGSQATSAVVQGSGAASFTFGTAQTLSFTVGGTTQNVNFGVGTYSKQQVLDAINSQSTLATASLDTATGDIQVVSKATGAGAGSIVVGNILASTANTVLGFSSGATSNGLDATAGVNINSANDTLNLAVDGTTLSPITLTQGATQTVGSVIDDLNAAFATQHVGAVAGQDADGHLQITSNSTGVNSGVQVLAGTANSVLGFSSTGVTSQGTDSNIGFGASGASFSGNTATAAPVSSPDVDAGGASQTSALSFTPLLYGSDSQTVTIAANNSSGAQQSLSVVLKNSGTNTSGASIDQAISAINTQLQQSNNATLQQIVAVKEDNAGTEQIKFMSTVSGFQVSIGTNANVTGLGAPTPGSETVPPQQGSTVSSTVTAGGSSADISNQSSAEAAVTALGNAVNTLGNAQAAVGKGENLFTYATNLAQSQLTNLASAESGIRDANLAAEAANLTKAQILMQAGVAALAQANSAPQQILTLLRGS